MNAHVAPEVYDPAPEVYDPIEYIKKLMIDNGMMEAAEIKKIDQTIRKEVDAAVNAAKDGTKSTGSCGMCSMFIM